MVHGRESAAQVQSNNHRFLRAEGALLGDDIFERPAFQELHPEADAAAEVIGIEDRHDVRVADPGEQPRFPDEDGVVIGRIHFAQQLERDFPLEARVPCAEHRAVRSATTGREA